MKEITLITYSVFPSDLYHKGKCFQKMSPADNEIDRIRKKHNDCIDLQKVDSGGMLLIYNNHATNESVLAIDGMVKAWNEVHNGNEETVVCSMINFERILEKIKEYKKANGKISEYKVMSIIYNQTDEM